jgi:hypothetical protein
LIFAQSMSSSSATSIGMGHHALAHFELRQHDADGVVAVHFEPDIRLERASGLERAGASSERRRQVAADHESATGHGRRLQEGASVEIHDFLPMPARRPRA